MDVVLISTLVILLLALASPLIMAARDSYRQHACQNRLRTIGAAMSQYHQMHGRFPAAGVWSTNQMQSLALHRSRRIDLYTQANWVHGLLPFLDQEELAAQFDPDLPISAEANDKARNTRLPELLCPSDDFNASTNPYLLQPPGREPIAFARGNYAINGGSHCFEDGPGTTAFLTGDHAHVSIKRDPRSFKMWGNGIAGFNVCFSEDDFENGTANLIAIEEVRAGVHAIDPRGVWSLGQIGGSVTWAHGVNGDAYGPNNQHPKSDDLLGGELLNQTVGPEFLSQNKMPCVSYVDLNFQATSRSAHAGGVNVAMVDGATRFVSDRIDPGLWHVLHSRETPKDLLHGDLDGLITTSFSIPDSEMSNSGIVATSAKAVSEESNSVGMRFVLLPAGEFIMGLPDAGNSHQLPEECPQHPVSLPRSFYMGIHEVTRSQYATVMGELATAKCEIRPETDDRGQLPMTGVTWHEAVEFCRCLSSREAERHGNRSYRLPTEAEWEYGCRAGSREPYRWAAHRSASDESGDAAGILPPLPLTGVGSFPPNEFGLFDMRGNAWEWCQDWFDREYYLRSPQENPQGPKHGYVKVVRGSSWTFIGEECKLSYPMMPPWKSSPVVGFRVVCEIGAPNDDSVVTASTEGAE